MKLLDCTAYANRPIAFERVDIHYEQFIFGADGSVLPSFMNAIKTPSDRWQILDIESWNDPIRLQQFVTDLKLQTGNKIGVYSEAPKFSYHDPVPGYFGDPKHSPVAWKRENDKRKGLAAVVDAIFPSLYCFYDDLAGWEKYAMANLLEARRIAPGKPIYPFIWPRFHDSNAKLAEQFVPQNYFEKFLYVCGAYADGAVLWDGYRPTETIDETTPWIKAYRKFAAEGGLNL